MEEVIFLFLYHQLDSVTRRHYEQLQRWHPGRRVVPLVYQYRGREVLPGTEDIALDWDYGWPVFNAWLELDKIYMRWFLKPGRPRAERYVFFEYDIYANAPAEVFYGPAWHAPVAAARIGEPHSHPHWTWWCQERWLEEAFAFRCGLIPMAATLWSYEALDRIAHTPRFQRCISELRMGTLARFLGFQPVPIPGAGATIRSRPELTPSSGTATWFHPVKQ
jgi:hypothetical protein